MRFFKVLPKKKILSVHVKDKSCSSSEGLQPYKETPTQLFSGKSYKSFRDSFFIK